MILRGLGATNVIMIPPQLEGVETVAQLLNDKCNVEMKPSCSTNGSYFESMPVIGTLGLMIAAYTSSNKIVVGVSGILVF